MMMMMMMMMTKIVIMMMITSMMMIHVSSYLETVNSLSIKLILKMML